nr:ABC transporter substrate-binding protein [Chlamydia abortus]
MYRIHIATQLLQKNLIHWVGSPWSSPISKEDQHRIPKDKLHNYPELGITALICNLKHSLTNSLALRKALAYAIDKTTLQQFIRHGMVAEHFPPPELSQLPKQSYQSPEECKELACTYFKEAEEELSPKYIAELSINYPLESVCLNAIVQEIQQQIKNVLGINVPIQGQHRALRFSAILKMTNQKKSLTKWENTQYNHILMTLLSKDETMKDQIIAEELIEEDLPIIPLYHFEHTSQIIQKFKAPTPHCSDILT